MFPECSLRHVDVVWHTRHAIEFIDRALARPPAQPTPPTQEQLSGKGLDGARDFVATSNVPEVRCPACGSMEPSPDGEIPPHECVGEPRAAPSEPLPTPAEPSRESIRREALSVSDIRNSGIESAAVEVETYRSVFGEHEQAGVRAVLTNTATAIRKLKHAAAPSQPKEGQPPPSTERKGTPP